jgi:hypothetical protein
MVYITTVKPETTVTAPRIQGTIQGTYNLGGSPVMGANINANHQNTIMNLKTPSEPSDAATKDYADQLCKDASRICAGTLAAGHGGTGASLAGATGILRMDDGVASAVSAVTLDALDLAAGPFRCRLHWPGGPAGQTLALPTVTAADVLAACGEPQTLRRKTIVNSRLSDSVLHTVARPQRSAALTQTAGWHMVPCDTSQGDCDIVLPAALNNAAILTFYTARGSSGNSGSTGSVKVSTAGTDVFAGGGRTMTVSRSGSLTVVSDQAGTWIVLARVS